MWKEKAITYLLRKLSAEEKHEILTFAVKKLFNATGQDDILKEDKETRQWFFQNRLLPREEMKLMAMEADKLLDSKLWNVLMKDLEWQANKQMFLSGKSEMDIIAGKMLLWSRDVIMTRLRNMRMLIKKL